MKTFSIFLGVSFAQYDYGSYTSESYDSGNYESYDSESYSDSYYDSVDWKSDSYESSYSDTASFDPTYYDVYSDEKEEPEKTLDLASVLDLFAADASSDSSSASQSSSVSSLNDDDLMQLDVYEDDNIYLEEVEEVLEEYEEPEENDQGSLLDSLGARYFAPITAATSTVASTVIATTTSTTYTSNWKCWHCDESSLTDCFNNGMEKECHTGDYGSCMTEVTEENGQMRNICMGCKQADACQRAKMENFWDYLNDPVVAAARDASPVYDAFTKCKPETKYNRNQRSYCRQCCYTSNCFSTAGYTDKTGTVTPWATVIQWGRTEWRADLNL